MERYLDRQQAGKILAHELKDYAGAHNTIILALPRGGVPVAYEVAKTLSLPLDILIVRKLGVPGHEELAMGAIAMQNTIVFNENILSDLNIPQTAVDQVIETEQQELRRREMAYRDDRPFPEITDKTVILIDDGIATGATMRAAITAIRQKIPAHIVVAVPVAAIDTCEEISSQVDEFVCPLRPGFFYGVGAWYTDFSQTTDDEVYQLLQQSHQDSDT